MFQSDLQKNTKISFPNLISSALIVSILLVAWTAPAFAGETAVEPTVTVSATGRAELVPDMAVLSLAVVREAETARDALGSNNRAMKAVIKALEDAGIKPSDMQTANFYIQPRYRPQNSLKSISGKKDQPQIIGYRVSNGLNVKVRDLNILGTVLDRVVTLGVNSGGNIQFTSQNPEPAISLARAKAMKKAIAKANTLVEAAGARLGSILTISEGVEARRPVRMAMAQASFRSAPGPSVPLASGENTYSVTVNASWLIDR